MTTLSDIEQAVAKLPADQLVAFRAWFDEFEAELFDRRIAEDARSGRLDHLAAEALADLRRGDLHDL